MPLLGIYMNSEDLFGCVRIFQDIYLMMICFTPTYSSTLKRNKKQFTNPKCTNFEKKNDLGILWISNFPQNLALSALTVSEKVSFTDGRTTDYD